MTENIIKTKGYTHDNSDTPEREGLAIPQPAELAGEETDAAEDSKGGESAPVKKELAKVGEQEEIDADTVSDLDHEREREVEADESGQEGQVDDEEAAAEAADDDEQDLEGDSPTGDVPAKADEGVCKEAQPFNVNKATPLDRKTFPNKVVDQAGNVRLPGTIPNLEHMLDSYGITARYNVGTKSMQVNIPGLSGCPDNADNSAITHVTSLAALNGLPTGSIHSYLEAIADKHQYNPVLDYICRKPWDGVKRIDELADTLITEPGFPESLKKILVRRWLVSAVAAAAMPTGFRSRGVLSLQGPQSIGKTSWILKLIDDPLLRDQAVKIDHHLDPGNKDSLVTAVSHWIVEVGELDSSFKKDIARLKGFITADQDKVRRPYGRKDSVYPRRTVFIATVNHENFLVDDTGNSRWWTIPVTSINYDHDINMQQVWAQAYQLYQDRHAWWLMPEEERELEVHNAKHRAVNSVRDMVCAALDMDRPESDRTLMSASEVLKAIGITNPSNAQCRDCGTALRELVGNPKVSQGISRWKVPMTAYDGPLV